MRTLDELLKAQIEYNFYEASDDEKRFIRGTAKSMVKAWLEERIKDFEDKQDIVKYQTVPVTYQWIESRKKFAQELVAEINASLCVDTIKGEK